MWGAAGGAAGLVLLVVRLVGGIGLSPLALAPIVVAGIVIRDAALPPGLRTW